MGILTRETFDTLTQVLSEDRIFLTSVHGSVEFVSEGSRLTMKAER